jgi:hypothetical protein
MEPSSGGSFTPGGMIPYSSAPNTDLQPGDLSAPGDGLKAKADAFHQQAVSQGLVPVALWCEALSTWHVPRWPFYVGRHTI